MWLRDAEALFPKHSEELTLDKDICSDPYPDVGKFKEVENQNRLLIVTARDDGRLVGYWLGALLDHLHYRNAGVMGYTDMYFVLSEYRVGGAGVKLLTTVEDELRQRGAVKMYLSCKVHSDHSQLFERMGFTKTDYMFTKRLK